MYKIDTELDHDTCDEALLENLDIAAKYRDLALQIQLRLNVTRDENAQLRVTNIDLTERCRKLEKELNNIKFGEE